MCNCLFWGIKSAAAYESVRNMNIVQKLNETNNNGKYKLL